MESKPFTLVFFKSELIIGTQTTQDNALKNILYLKIISSIILSEDCAVSLVAKRRQRLGGRLNSCFRRLP